MEKYLNNTFQNCKKRITMCNIKSFWPVFAKQNRYNCVIVCLKTMSNNSLAFSKLLPHIFYLCFLLSLLLLGNKAYFYGWTSATPERSPLTRKSAKPVVTTLSDDLMFVPHTDDISIRVSGGEQKPKKTSPDWRAMDRCPEKSTGNKQAALWQR